MGIISKLFNSNTESKYEDTLPWINLTSLNQLETIKANSVTKTQIIFKHSTRCGISRMVLNQFTSQYNLSEETVDLYFLDLLNFRDISNEIEGQFTVQHQSPQLIIVKNGIAVAHASHGEINEINLNQY